MLFNQNYHQNMILINYYLFIFQFTTFNFNHFISQSINHLKDFFIIIITLFYLAKVIIIKNILYINFVYHNLQIKKC